MSDLIAAVVEGVTAAMIGIVAAIIEVPALAAMLALTVAVHWFADGVVAWWLTCGLALLCVVLLKRYARRPRHTHLVVFILCQLIVVVVYGFVLASQAHGTLALFGSAGWIIGAVALAVWVPTADSASLKPSEVEDHD